MTEIRTAARTRVAAVAVVLAALAVLVPSPASAQDPVDVTVTTPADGRYLPGRTTPFLVSISADRAVEGTARIVLENITIAEQAFELPGGTEKQLVMTAAFPPWFGNPTVVVDVGDDSTTTRLNLVPANGDELVGVMPGLATDLPETAPLSVDLGVARLHAVDTTLLPIGPEVLGAYSVVVVGADDLAGLGEGGLGTVSDWAAAGGNLVLDTDAADATALGALPLLDPDTGRIGLGTVTFTEGRIDDSGFDGVLAPTSASISPDELPFGFFGFGGSSMQTLAADAGVRVPEIGSIVLFLVVYVLAIGPIAYLITRRSNREPLLWLAIPVVAVLATGAVWLIGRQLRDNVTTAHATLVLDTPAGRSIRTETLVSSPNGGRVGVRLDDGWRPASSSIDEAMMFGEFGEFGRVQVATPRLDGDELTVDLPPGGLAVVNAERTLAPAAVAWGIDARLEEDSLEVTLTNDSGSDLVDIIVAMGSASRSISDLAAGASVDVSLADPGGFTIEGDPIMESMWRAMDRPRDSAVSPNTLGTVLAANPGLRAADNLVVVGWTRDAPGPLSARGREVEVGRTGFMSVAPVSPAGGVLDPRTNRVEIIRGWNGTRVTDPVRGGEEVPVTMRLVPTGTVPDDAVIDVPRFVAALDVWDGSDWIPAGMAEVPNGQGRVLALPDGAIADGALYLRLHLGQNFWNARNPLPTLRPRAADDEVVALEDIDV